MSDLGDRMKRYEAVEAKRRLDQSLPICARIDGKCFSTWTRGLKRPFDARLSRLMIATTLHLVEESGALAGYSQSDEITLVWHTDNPKSQMWLDGRTQKLTSILASITTGYFNARLPETLPEKRPGSALFDARVWNLPSQEEAVNLFLWRERDATKNAISQAARAYFSHKELMNKTGTEMRAMLEQIDVDWDAFPSFFTRGTFVARRTITRTFTTDELERLPAQHQARQNPQLMIERSDVQELSMPAFDIVRNRVGVLFNGEEPST